MLKRPTESTVKFPLRVFYEEGQPQQKFESDSLSQSSSCTQYKRSQSERAEILKNLTLYEEIFKQLYSEHQNLNNLVDTRNIAIEKMEIIINNLKNHIDELKARLLIICQLNMQKQQENQQLHSRISELMKAIISEREEKQNLINNLQNIKNEIHHQVELKNSLILKKQQIQFQKKQYIIQSEMNNMKQQIKYQQSLLEKMQIIFEYQQDKTLNKVQRYFFYPLSKSDQPKQIAYRWSERTLTLQEKNTDLHTINGTTFNFSKKENKQIKVRVKMVNYSIGYIGINTITQGKYCQYSSQLFKTKLDPQIDTLTNLKENSFYEFTLNMKRSQSNLLFISIYINRQLVECSSYGQFVEVDSQQSQITSFRLFFQLKNGGQLGKRKTSIKL